MYQSIEVIDYADQNGIGRQNFLEKYRVQVPLILLTTIAVQSAIALPLYGEWPLPDNVQNSILVALVANLLGLFSYSRLRLYPGTRRLAFILPSFAIAWSLAFAVIVAARIPYSSAQLAVGSASALGLALLLNAWNRRPDMAPFLVVPSKRVKSILSELPDLKVTTCHSVKDIDAAKTAIVADLHADLPAEWENALAQAALRGNPIYHVKHVGESLTGRVQIEHLSENSLGSLAPDSSYAFLKSMVERLAALIVLIVTAPIMLIAVIAVRLDSPGPSLFRQTRIGYRGRPFTICKLRTMSHTTGPRTREDDVTVENDPRITRLGRFLRSSRLDEIPQLINVLRGDMSIIGPRPETERLSHWYAENIDFYAYRHIVLPGITGWAQVKQGHVASQEDVMRKLQYDFYYIKNYSLWLDVVIALKTVKVMLLKMGAK
ncbi:MAG: sugar transferase [Pseudomonadota bacterium]